MKLNSGDNNVSKRPEVRAKISERTTGKPKNFGNLENPRLLKRKLTTAGYVLVWDEVTKKYTPEHRLLLGLSQMDGKQVHHIDGNKRNNSKDN